MISSCCDANPANWMHRLVSGGRISSKGTLLRESHCFRKAGRTGHPRNDGGVAATPEAAGRVTEWRAARAPYKGQLTTIAKSVTCVMCGMATKAVASATIDTDRARVLIISINAFESCFAERQS